jgi:hypothetical protein
VTSVAPIDPRGKAAGGILGSVRPGIDMIIYFGETFLLYPLLDMLQESIAASNVLSTLPFPSCTQVNVSVIGARTALLITMSGGAHAANLSPWGI